MHSKDPTMQRSELKATIRATRALITPEQCHRLIDSMPHESRFYLSTCDRCDRLWRHSGECYAACNTIQHDRFGGGPVMVWGGISLEGRTDLYRLDNGTLTAIRYQDEILGPVVKPYAGAVGPGFLLVHNNARPHVARVCRQFLENEGIDTIDWPTGSPGLNSIEHLWDIMFRSIQRHQVALQTIQELSDALVQIWEEIPQDTICTVDFTDAQVSCERKQGALMSVRTTEVNDVILDLLKELSGHFWIGLIHASDTCTDPSYDLRGYSWITGDNATRFRNWKSDGISCSRRCVSVSRNDGKWAERRCNDTEGIAGYLCEYQNTEKCGPLTSKASVLYQTPFGFSRVDLSEVPNSSNATRLDLSSKHICLEGQWLHAPWSCEVYRGGCEHSCDKSNDTYVCNCPPGYELQSNAVSCKKALNDPCQGAGCSHSCLPKGKSYECLCQHGFLLDADGKTCKDINECEDKRVCPGRNFQCVNTLGSFECHCMSGFRRERDICEDDDECASGPCDHSCVNTQGGYNCECSEGYQVSLEDKHKCALHCPQWECPAVDCDPNSPHQCDCPRGFILEERPTGLFCVDIDECVMSYCDQDCKNTIGGYICSCNEGFNLIGNAKCEKTGISQEPHTTPFDLFTPTPTETPSGVSTGGRLAISMCIIVDRHRQGIKWAVYHLQHCSDTDVVMVC
ncbi:hypothetical protein NFI96_005924 [Prochilodus magdalenae]|nr:hypothetical protein NFI96_005924 [Prochilodus magdalenae]